MINSTWGSCYSDSECFKPNKCCVLSKQPDGALGFAKLSDGAGVCVPGGDGVVPAGQGFSGWSYSCDKGDDDKTVAMWGGKGHDVIHAVKKAKGHMYCIQISGKKVADDAAWIAKGTKWATKHNVTIEDGKCPKQFTHETHQMNGHGLDVKVLKN